MIVFAFVTMLLVSAAPPQVGGEGAVRAPRRLEEATSVASRQLVALDRTAATSRRPHRRARGPIRAKSSGLELPVRSDAYGTRARRRFASYLRLRLLEMREAGLERAAAVIERRLPVDVLVPTLRTGDVPGGAVP